MRYERIRDIRIRRNETLEEFAKHFEVKKSTCSKWENGEQIIPLKHLITLCNLSHTELDYVLGLTNKKRKVTEERKLDPASIGKRLTFFRKKYHLTQEQLANILNTTQSTISYYEKGKTTLLTVFLYDICARYKVSSDWFCKTDDHPKM